MPKHGVFTKHRVSQHHPNNTKRPQVTQTATEFQGILFEAGTADLPGEVGDHLQVHIKAVTRSLIGTGNTCLQTRGKGLNWYCKAYTSGKVLEGPGSNHGRAQCKQVISKSLAGSDTRMNSTVSRTRVA